MLIPKLKLILELKLTLKLTLMGVKVTRGTIRAITGPST